MPLNSEIVISDTSCLILLSKVDELILLHELAEKVYVTPAIQSEFGRELPSWIIVKEPKDYRYQKILEIDLDKGEANAIALSLDFDDAIIIIDDLKARKIAEWLNLKYSGTFGVILKAKQAGIIDSVKPILNKIKNTNFRFSDELFDMIIHQAGE